MPRGSSYSLPKGKTYVTAYTKKMCERDATRAKHNKLIQCEADWTDPGTNKCYHDALNKYTKDMKACKKLQDK